MAREAIFIGYRRDDTADVAGRIYDALSRRFGKARIFKDVDNLPIGAEFGDYIQGILPRCRVVLALIGPHWAEAKDEAGRRRLENPDDWVRVEIETALATPRLDVVPVLVNGAPMPRPEDVPESLRPLLRRQAARIRRDPDFHDDVERLGRALNASVNTGILDLASIGGDRRTSQAGAAPHLTLPRWTVPAAAIAMLFAALLFWSPWRPSAPALPDARRVDMSTVVPLLQDRAQLHPFALFKDCEDCPEMVVIPNGRFVMGASPDEPQRDPGEGPERRMTILNDFAVGREEVTFDQWEACAHDHGCTFVPSDNGWGQGDRPVINVSWVDAQAYVRWLSAHTHQHYRLLFDLEWEYAARAGSRDVYPWGADENQGCTYANGPDQTARRQHGNNAWAIINCDDGAYRTALVGSYRPNAFGLYDTIGNVWEWVQDCTSRQGAAPLCVLRGGSWFLKPQYLRVAYRNQDNVASRHNNVGFRVARSL